MRELLKEQYQFSDFQIAQLEYVWKTVTSELSKLLIMGILFHDRLGLYLFAMAVMVLRVQAFVIIFFYLTLTYIVPESPYITVGFWVIILHTLQLITAKLIKMKGAYDYERKTCQVE